MTNAKIVGFDGEKKKTDQVYCTSCRHCYSKGVNPQDFKESFECRAHPPTLNFLAGQSQAGIQIMPVTGYPGLREDQPVCGEFKAKLDT